MSIIASDCDRCVPGGLARFLDARLCLGMQFGTPVEVTVRQALRQTPCLFLMAALIGLALFI